MRRLGVVHRHCHRVAAAHPAQVQARGDAPGCLVQLAEAQLAVGGDDSGLVGGLRDVAQQQVNDGHGALIILSGVVGEGRSG